MLKIADFDIVDISRLMMVSGHLAYGDEFDPTKVSDENLKTIASSSRPTLLMSKAPQNPQLVVYGQNMAMFTPGWPRGAQPFQTSWDEHRFDDADSATREQIALAL